MFCPKCGKELFENAYFCMNCGARVRNTEKTERYCPDDDKQYLSGNEKADSEYADAQRDLQRKRAKRRKITTAFAVCAVLVILVFVTYASQGKVSFIKNRYSWKESNSSRNIAMQALPELPDTVAIWDYDYEAMVLMDIGHHQYKREMQASENGNIVAVQDAGGGEVKIYDSSYSIVRYTIPESVNYFYLCPSGEMVVYGTSDNDTYVWDIETGKKHRVSNDRRVYGTSYNGMVLDFGDSYCINGEEPVDWNGASLLDASSEGEIIYYRRLVSTGDGYSAFGVIMDGIDYELARSRNTGTVPRIVSLSNDYKEALFELDGEIYFFSAEYIRNPEHQAYRVDGYDGSGLISLTQAKFRSSINSEDDTVSQWLIKGNIAYSNNYYYPAGELDNSLYLLLKRQNGINTIALVKYHNGYMEEVIPNITGNIFLSDDGTRLWCEADGKLAFCNPSPDEVFVSYCDSVLLGMTSDGIMNLPIAASQDREKVYFIDINGDIWKCTLDTINDPEFLLAGYGKSYYENILWVWCSAEDEVYVMFQDKELWMITEDGYLAPSAHEINDLYITKTYTYAVTEDETDDTGKYYDLYSVAGQYFTSHIESHSDNRLSQIYWTY